MFSPLLSIKSIYFDGCRSNVEPQLKGIHGSPIRIEQAELSDIAQRTCKYGKRLDAVKMRNMGKRVETASSVLHWNPTFRTLHSISSSIPLGSLLEWLDVLIGTDQPPQRIMVCRQDVDQVSLLASSSSPRF
ncbi:hypothetical protein KIN20_019834 [Parelaphostrongylus tenuis]|uniref:Uncharacterized protein n=1 Tax=Parelaphostrongylus tenuis TaxID=148309 RepID=A0AAD5QV97_PARTN|nr:hypothetical protein KIN20_019834 [Parelaphostrongylus tenuis]